MSGDAPIVLEIAGSLASAYCARLLTVGGADVLRLEPPGGSSLRKMVAAGHELADDEDAALFGWLASGQRSATVDITVPGSIDAVLSAVVDADAVIWSPSSPLASVVMLEQVVDVAPDAVVVAISDFGLTGPWSHWPATEFTLQAMSGGPAMRGSRAWPPMSAGGRHGDYMVGAVAALAALTGLRRRVLGGPGGVFDVSGLEALVMTQLFNPITMEHMDGGVRGRRAKATVADIAPSSDGWVGFAVVNRLQHWHDFCAMIGRPDWADDPTLDLPGNRSERSDELTPVIEAWTKARTTAEIVELASLFRIPVAEVGHGESIPSMEHFAARDFFERNPAGFMQPAAPFRLEPSEAPTIVAPAPPVGPPITAGQRRAPMSRTRAARLPELPLAGIRIADFTSFWAGPFMTHIMAMLGAEVIHVESTRYPDGSRLMGYRSPDEPRWWEWSPFFQATNTNKRAITLDMSTPDGRTLACRLVEKSDVVVENYSPRVMEEWGLGWDDVRSLRPDAVMVRMPAFGLRGPWRDRTGFAMTMEQVSGMAWLTGFPDQRPAALFGPCDPSAGIHAAIGLMVGLERRRRTGEGCLVESPMVASALNVAAEQVIQHSAYGVRLDRDGNRGPGAAPQGCYRCVDVDDDGNDRWISLAVATDEQWEGLRRALGAPGWTAASEFASMAGRREHHDELDRHLSTWCAHMPAQQAVDLLRSAGVPVAIVVHPSEQVGFEQLETRGFFERVVHSVAGATLHVTFPFRVPDYDGPVHRNAAPTLGQHNTEVLGGLLGVTPEELSRLAELGVIGTELVG